MLKVEDLRNHASELKRAVCINDEFKMMKAICNTLYTLVNALADEEEYNRKENQDG